MCQCKQTSPRALINLPTIHGCGGNQHLPLGISYLSDSRSLSHGDYQSTQPLPLALEHHARQLTVCGRERKRRHAHQDRGTPGRFRNAELGRWSPDNVNQTSRWQQSLEDQSKITSVCVAFKVPAEVCPQLINTSRCQPRAHTHRAPNTAHPSSIHHHTLSLSPNTAHPSSITPHPYLDITSPWFSTRSLTPTVHSYTASSSRGPLN